ncbi:MAG: hypothetical protein GYA23_12340 [Methanomicrobiales archaeon]|nr:hypothetical protein [Methanomicrobiales archaeon]
MACICYKMSSGKQSHPITWITLETYPHTEAGYHAALKHQVRLLDSEYAIRITSMRDEDSRKVWAVQQCSPWKCCIPENT